MRAPVKPVDETKRLSELRSLSILDSAAEGRFDRITRLAQRLFGVSTALVTLVDDERQWFKSRVGLDVPETSRNLSFCAHAILNDGIMLVPDAAHDERFWDNPLVAGSPDFRFYAGCPITGPAGAKLGTLCILDQRPRELSAVEMDSLRDLAEMVEDEIAASKMAVTDPISGLGNRQGFERAASAVLEINRRRAVDTALLFIDLAKFKAINDQFGHHEGDLALREFGEILTAILRVSDLTARLESDEFVALLSGRYGPETAIQRLQNALESRNEREDKPYLLQASFGVATAKGDQGETLHSLMQRAAEATSRNKHRR